MVGKNKKQSRTDQPAFGQISVALTETIWTKIAKVWTIIASSKKSPLPRNPLQAHIAGFQLHLVGTKTIQALEEKMGRLTSPHVQYWRIRISV